MGHTISHTNLKIGLVNREVLPETFFLLVIMTADAQAGPFFSVKHYAYQLM